MRWQNGVATVLETGTHFSDWHLCQSKEMCSNLPITCPSSTFPAQQQPLDFFFFLSFLLFFTGAAALGREEPVTTKLSRALSVMAWVSWGAVWPSG